MTSQQGPTTTTKAASSLPPPNIEIESLKHLALLLQQQRNRRVLLPVDERWFQLVHGGEDRMPATIVNEFFRLADKGPQKPAAEIVKRVAAVVPGSRPGEFMGPMCCPLTRVDLESIRNPENKYLITEKSDGLRAIMLSIAEDNFPRWTVIPADPSASQPPLPPQPVCRGLFDTLTLELALTRLYETNDTIKHGIQLSTGIAALVPSHSDETPHVIRERSAKGDVSTQYKRSKDTRHFTYLFDRTLTNVYLLLDEVPFSPDVTNLVLDGELIFSFGRDVPQCVFSCFDVFSWENIIRDANGVATSTHREIIADASMSERYVMIAENVLTPMFQHAKKTGRVPPTGIALTRKTMVTIDKLPDLIRNIFVVPKQASAAGKDPMPTTADNDCKYFFAPTISYNDGLVFTPDKFDLVAGSCPTQFKWKWPAKLTVDFRLKDSPGSDPPDQSDGPAQRVAMELYFKQRGTKDKEELLSRGTSSSPTTWSSILSG